MIVSSETREMLQRAGWKPGRRVDISEYERVLAADGYVLGCIASQFIQEFGGLVVWYMDRRVPANVMLLRLDPAHAASNCWPGNVALYEERVRERLVVIGEVYEDTGFLLMSESGKVYIGLNERLIRVGGNGYEALETICEGIESRMIDIP